MLEFLLFHAAAMLLSYIAEGITITNLCFLKIYYHASLPDPTSSGISVTPTVMLVLLIVRN
jgi:hypothetical protein